jgi:hypothetical protein
MSTSNHPAQNGPKKMSTSMVIITACLLGVVVGLFGLNYWHASRCGGTKSADELETYVEGINKRLLQAESLVGRIRKSSNHVQTNFALNHQHHYRLSKME